MEKCPKVNNPLYCGSRVKNADASVAVAAAVTGPVLGKKNMVNIGPLFASNIILVVALLAFYLLCCC